MELEFIESNKHPKTEKADVDAIDLGFQKTAKEKARTMAEGEAHKPGQLTPQEALQLRYEKELQEEFTDLRKRLSNGVSKIVESLKALSQENPAMMAEDVTDAFDTLAILSKVIDEEEEAFNEQISQGVTIQDLTDISDETVDKLYQGAKALYEKSLYQDASDAFLFLTNISPKNFCFWLGLANAYYCLSRYNEAIEACEAACSTSPGDPNGYVSISRCYEALGELDKAINALDSALLKAEENAEFRDVIQSLQEDKIRLAGMQRH